MRAACSITVLLLLIGAGCGNGDPEASPDPFVAVEREFDRAQETPKAAPRWERVTVLEGTGPEHASVGISDAAIQWRASLRCPGPGSVTARSAGTESVARCGARPAEFIGTGPRTLRIAGTGAWRAVVEQQVETPLADPPLAGADRPLLSGAFASVERDSEGRASVHRSGRRLVLRLEGFRTEPNTDLFVWILRSRAPQTSREAIRAPHRVLAPLRATRGDQNYPLPRGIRLRDLRSIVIWCEPIRIAYASASLRPARG